MEFSCKRQASSERIAVPNPDPDALRVLDGGTFQGLNNGTPFTRAIRVPPIWKFNAKSDCPRAQYDYADSSVGSTDPSQSAGR